MLTIVQHTLFATVVLDGFLLSMKGSSSTNQSPSPSFFFGLGVTNDAAKPDCILPTGDNGSSYEGRFSGKLIVIEINEALLSRKQQLRQKCKHQQSHFNFPNTDLKTKILLRFLY